MGLQRYSTYTLWDKEGDPLDERPRSVFTVFDVLEWRDSIRAAVEAERASDPAVNHRCDCPFGWCDGRCPTLTARAALDALLAEGSA